MAGSSSVLASKYVEISQKGAGSVVAYLVQMQEELKRATYQQQQMNRHLKDGTYQKAANQMVGLNRQYTAMQKAARFQDLIAEHGKFGASLAMIHERTAGLGRAAQWGFGLTTGATMGWVTAGMAGTVEAYRLEMAFRLLSREIAGVFKPTIDSVTGWIFKAGNSMRGMDGDQQSALRSTVLWTAGIFGGIIALRVLIGTLMAVRTAIIATGVASGSAGALLGSFFTKGALLRFGLAGAALYGLGKLVPEGDEENEKRYGEGHEKLVGSGLRGIEMFGRNLLQRWHNPEGFDKWSRKATLIEKDKYQTITPAEKEELTKLRGEKTKEDVALAQTGFEGIGSAYDRISNEFLKIDDPAIRAANAAEELNKKMEDTRSLLQQGVDWLGDMVSGKKRVWGD